VKSSQPSGPLSYIAFHKPYGVLSQFTPEDGARSLAEFNLPAEVYPAGRLDKDSEGLLLLTNDGDLIHRLLEPKHDKQKTYWVQIERIPTEETLTKLRKGGIEIQDYKTLPCEIQRMEDPSLPPRDPPIRVRLSVPDCWLEIKLKEGKNRQVRRMTAAVGHPTLRLVRVQIGALMLENLAPGEWREVGREEILKN
jgi:23S rRNA pseudouridine2457 synthase